MWNTLPFQYLNKILHSHLCKFYFFAKLEYKLQLHEQII